MPETPPTHPTLLDELDARQNDVLNQLDDLNGRVERLLREFSQPSGSRARDESPGPQGVRTAVEGSEQT